MSKVVGKYTINLQNHRNGLKSMFRTKEERTEQMKSTGGRKTKSNWFRGDSSNTTTTITVPVTPRGLLAQQIQTTIASCPPPGKCKTRVREGEGVTVKRNIMRSNPFPKQSCGREDCLLDRLSDKGCQGACYKEDVGYAGTCMRCRNYQQEDGKPLKMLSTTATQAKLLDRCTHEPNSI